MCNVLTSKIAPVCPGHTVHIRFVPDILTFFPFPLNLSEYKVVIKQYYASSGNGDKEHENQEYVKTTTLLTNQTRVFSSNFTSNTTYSVQLSASTSVGYGPTDVVYFTTSDHFQGWVFRFCIEVFDAALCYKMWFD